MMRERLSTLLAPELTIERELGGGGMSLVFLARDNRLGRRVVIKVVQPELAVAMSGGRFEREIQLAASLQQANIVPLLTAGEAEEIRYYTMPFVEGESLRARLARGPLSESETVTILRDVTRALIYAHERGVIHRDIKPDNVLLSGESAVVTDFGIAKAISAASTIGGVPSHTLTQQGAAIGTPTYMAPEQAMGDPTVDPRADLYALGCMAFELLTGSPPFQRETVHQLLVAHLTDPAPTVTSRRPTTDPALEALIADCLAKSPAERPPSARAVLQRLDAVASGEHRAARRLSSEAEATTLVVPTPPPTAGRSRRRLITPIAIGSLALLIGWGVFGRGAGPSLLATGQVADDSRLLVTRFETSAADTSLGAIVAQGVRSALGQSEAVRVVSPSEVASALARMTLPAATPLSLSTAQELATREGIPLLVAGQVAALGGGLVVSVSLVRADSGDVLVSLQEGADGPSELIEAIDALTRALRQRIGETRRTIARTPRLAEVTTPSLDALREYTRAVERGDQQGDLAGAIPLLEQAVSIDSTFASAWRKLSVYRANTGASTAATLAATAAAYRHRERSVGTERLQIESWYLERTSSRKAVAFFQAHPGLNDGNLAAILFQLGRITEADSLVAADLARSPDGRPQSIQQFVQVVGADALAGRLPEAYAAHGTMATAFPGAWYTEQSRTWLGWLAGGPDSVEVLAREALGSRHPSIRSLSVSMSTALAAARGQLRRHERLHAMQIAYAGMGGGGDAIAERIEAIVTRARLTRTLPEGMRALDALLRDTPERGVHALDRHDLAFARGFARIGAVAPAAAALERFERGTTAEERLGRWTAWQGVQGDLALIRGDAARALSAYRRAIDSDSGVLDWRSSLVMQERFARAFGALGQRDSAIVTLERLLRPTDSFGATGFGALWPEALRQLAALHEEAGRPREARRRYEELLRLWRDADPELQPQVAEIRARVAALPAR